MKKITNTYFDETYYREKLENGLEVIIFHKPEFLSSICAFGTPYGALKIDEIYKGKEYHFNPGIAHFLEHKLFEAQGDDIISAFSSLGANVNAFTSYRETVYYFTKTGEDISEPLNLLLDFVQSLNISEESVNKEKGIIAQELAMYHEMPDQRLLNETYASMYHNYPLKYDIGGTKESVYAITKKELEECYAINYHPSNMVLVVVTPIEPKEIIKVVRQNQKTKKFIRDDVPLAYDYKEPETVKRQKHSFKMNVNTAKHIYALKLKPNFKNSNDVFYKEWCLRFLLESHFSYLNPEYQKWLDQGIINDFFGYDIDFDMNSAFILFYMENDNPDYLIKLVNESLEKKLMNDSLLTQIKRRYVGQLFDSFNDIDSFGLGYIRDYLNGLDFFETIKLLNKIKLEDIYKIYNSFKYNNWSFVSLNKK